MKPLSVKPLSVKPLSVKRWSLQVLALLLASPAWADPRCARLGQPSYSATRIVTNGAEPPLLSRVFLAGRQMRLEAVGPGGARLVTLITPDLNAMFVTIANPPVAMRLPTPQIPGLSAEDRRHRQERAPLGFTLITEARGASGQWHEVERSLCRRDGVLLETRQWQPGEAGGVMLHIRQTEIRMATLDPALFRLPAEFRLIDPPPAQNVSRRIAPPPG